MKAPRHPSARRALALYAAAPRGDRVHVNVRWWTCPFTAVEAAVPRSGRILEVGCGHGLLSLYLGLAARNRSVVGVDIDVDKIAVAQQAAAALRPGEADVRFEVSPSGELPPGPFDAVVIADVLYLLQPEARRNLLVACAEAAGDRGVVLVKETATTPRWKGALTVAQEKLSTGVLRITEGDAVDFAEPAELAAVLELEGLRTHIERIDRGFPHPHALITARRSPADATGTTTPTVPPDRIAAENGADA